jgi:hypothetical protein
MRIRKFALVNTDVFKDIAQLDYRCNLLKCSYYYKKLTLYTAKDSIRCDS